MIPLSKPLIGEEEEEAVLTVLRSGQLAQGAVTEQFEQALADFCGVRHAVATSSGTTALQLALLAHGIGPGDEVITTPFTFIASSNSVLYCGAKPVFVDIEPDTFNIEPNRIEAAITPRTRAILPVHLYGNPADMAAILDIADRRGLIVVEDAAQAHGASINGRAVGSFATGCFSFYPTKNMTTGEGGAVTTNDDVIADRIRLLRAHGAPTRYRHDVLGYNFRMTDIHAAIGLAQLPKLDGWTERRRSNAARLSGLLRDQVTTPVHRRWASPVYHQYTIRVAAGREDLPDRLAAQGVASGVYYPTPVHRQPLYRQLGYVDILPEAERAAREVLSLPVHPALQDDELHLIAGALIDALSERHSQ
jgi:dTDP-4-amino-4,6-dideoxygalactose transaminase